MEMAIRPETLQERQAREAMKVIAKATPWTLSALIHIALVMVMLFTVFFTLSEIKPIELNVESALLDDSSAVMSASQPNIATANPATHNNRPTQHRPSMATTKIPPILSVDSPAAMVPLSGLQPNADISMQTSAAAGDKGIFNDNLGKAGRADNIVYVIDASGSMMLSSAAQAVREELYRALGRLSKKQSFGIIFFTGGRTLAFRKTLLAANPKNVYNAVDFAESVQSTGPSDARDALRQAFALLKNTAKKRNLICLLSDGELKDSPAVQTMLRELNPAGRVHVNTILTGSHESAAIRSMQDIATANGGSFKYVELAN